MAILYKLYQEKRHWSPNKGKWFAKTVRPQTIDLEQISKIIESNITAKQADVYAVLIELVNVMSDCLHEGWVVKIDGMGCFRTFLTSEGAESREAFDPKKNITGVHVRFLPYYQWNGAACKGNTKSIKMLQDYEVKELPF